MRQHYQHIITCFLIILVFKFCFCGHYAIFESDKRASDVTSTHTVKSVSQCAVISGITSGTVAFNYNRGTYTCELIGRQNVTTTNEAGWKVYAKTGEISIVTPTLHSYDLLLYIQAALLDTKNGPLARGYLFSARTT